MDIKALGLCPGAVARLEAGGISTVEQLTAIPARDLLNSHALSPPELHRVIHYLNEAGLSLPPIAGAGVRPPAERERRMLRLRLIEKLTLKEIGQRTGVSPERVRQLLNLHFGLSGPRR